MNCRTDEKCDHERQTAFKEMLLLPCAVPDCKAGFDGGLPYFQHTNGSLWKRQWIGLPRHYFWELIPDTPTATPPPDERQKQKRDGGKPQFSLLPFAALTAVVRVLEFGLWKYTRGGWKKVDEGEPRYLDALLRHASELGEHGLDHVDCCAEHKGVRPVGCKNCSGLPSLAHLACDALFLLWYRAQRLGTNDPGQPWVPKT